MRLTKVPLESVLKLACGLLAMTIAGGVNASDSMGRIFYTAEERRLLEQRLAGLVDETGTPTEAASAPAASTIHFNGLVRRSSGGTRAWVDGRPLETDTLPNLMRARLIGDRLEVISPAVRKILKAGERESVLAIPSMADSESSDDEQTVQ